MFQRLNNTASLNTPVATEKGINRRSVVFGGASALAVGALAYAGMRQVSAQESSATPAAGNGEANLEQTVKQRLDEYGFLWSAASPATHQGDTYTLTTTNRGTTAVKLLALSVLRNPRERYHSVAINEELELAAGDAHEFSATNDYGTASAFVTRIITTAADTSELALTVTLTAANGTESATFNELAFLVDSRDDIQKAREDRRAQRREARDARRDRVKKHARGGDNNDSDATPAADVSDTL